MSVLKKILSCALHRQLSRIDALYQRHAGQECYIFGDGVSLKWMDLRQFANRPAILGNFMIYHKEASALQALYCAITEPFFFWPFFPDGWRGHLRILRNCLQGEYRKVVEQNSQTLFFANFSNYPVLYNPNALYVSRFYAPPFLEKNPFREREDAHNGTFAFQLSLAVYLGFRKAYLVGHDYTHYPSRSLHFYEKGTGILTGQRGFSKDLIDYAKRYMELVTVTVDSGSETMEAVTYRDLTGQEPRFRENTDIVDMPKLRTLDRWWTYRYGGTIF